MVGPPNYSVGSDSSGKLSLTWDPPAALGGGNISYYLVQTSTDAVTWSAGDTTTAAPSNAGPFIVSGLTNGQPTYVRVAAVTEVGPGAWATGSATPRTVPSGITNLSATGTDHALNLSWTAPATGGSPLVGYAVYVALSTDASYTLVTSNTNSLSTNFTINTIGSSALSNGTQYKTYIKAINAAGMGVASNVYTGTPAGPAAAPGSLIASPSSSTSVGLLWSAPADFGGGNLTGYIVQKSLDGLNWTTQITTGPTVFTATVTGLLAGQTAFFRVAAITDGSITGNFIVSSAAPTSTPSAPQSPVASPTSLTQVTVTWAPPTSSGGRALTGYHVEYKLASDTTWITAIDDTSSLGSSVALLTAYSIAGLATGSTYDIRVAARNGSGAGDLGPTSAKVTTTITAAPGQPQAFVATAGDQQIVLSWSAPVDASSITGYKVEKYNGSSWVTETTTATTVTSYTFGSLANGSNYIFRITTFNNLGSGTPLPISATPFGAPAAPTALAVKQTSGQLLVTWAPPAAGTTGGSAVTAYVLEFTDSTTATVETVTVTGTSYSKSTIAGHTYLLRAASQTAPIATVSAPSGLTSTSTTTGAYSAQVSPTVAALPTEPNNLQLLASSGALQVTWDTPTSGAPDNYLVDYSTNGSIWTRVATLSYSAPRVANINSLTNGVPILVRVAGSVVAGTGPFSVKSATPSTVPGAPSSVTVIRQNAGLFVTWNAPTDNGGARIETYTVRVVSSSDTSTVFETATVTGEVSSRLMTTRALNTYKVFVTASNANGVGAGSAYVAEVSIPGSVAAISKVETSTVGDQVVLTWSSAVDATEYVVETRPATSASWSAGTVVTAPAVTKTIVGLTNGATYYARITGRNLQGSGPSSVVAITPIRLASAPQEVTAQSSTQSTGLVLWKAPVDIGGSVITGYVIETSTAAGDTSTVVQNSSTTIYALAGLASPETYTVRIAAITPAGQGPWSNSATLTTVPDALGITISNVVVAYPASNATSISWSDSDINTVSYTISYTYGLSGSYVDTTTTTPAIDLTGLTNGTNYFVRISSSNGSTSSPFVITSFTPRTTPLAVNSLTASSSIGALSLSWSAPTDLGGLPLIGYRVALSDSSSGLLSTETITATSKTFTGLSTSESYTVSVIAVTGVNGETPLVGADSTLTGLQVYARAAALSINTPTPTSGGAIVTWPVPSAASLFNGTNLGYHVE
ncbi:MAG: hypothetical protein EBU43_00935, partial [Actinobacteria bacterium]|nr:hypothetical protein [Actinomycetota bacterium]